MEPAQWEEVKEVFHHALELSGPKRDAFLRNLHSSNPQLGRRLEQMLLADADAGDFLETNWRVEKLAAAYAENDEAALQPDQIIQQRYRIVRLIGSGGMGRVYEAYDCELETHIALKTLREEFLARPDMLQRFRQEVRSAHRVTHPNVCRTYHLERTVIDGVQGPQSITFLTMELLTGVTLREHLREAGRLAPAQVLLIARKIATGLDAAHQAGIVHRDIKPGNIMLCGPERGRVVITDFGLARLNDPADSSRLTTLTGTRNAMGTPAYMAPEQLQGGQTTAAVDIYAFGMVLLEMCRPHAPGHAEQTGTTAQKAAKETVFPPAWRTVIEKCLHHDPAQRPQTALQVVDALYLEPRADSLLHASWQRIKTPRFFLPVAIFFLLIMSLFLFPLRLWKRAPGTELKSGALIYLAPLQNGTAQTSMDGVSELLKASLSQSTQIDLLDDARAGDILQSMAQKPDAAISPSLGREIAMRAGAVRVVFPRLSFSGKDFRLDLEVEQPSDTPARYRHHWASHWTWPADANTSEPAGEAVRDAADWLRHLAGEAADDIGRLSVPPEDATTANWEALEEYAHAERLLSAAKLDDGVTALQRATELDPQFSLAYARLGDVLSSRDRWAEGLTAYHQAMTVTGRERLTRRELDRVRGIYASDTRDYATAEAQFRDMASYYPDDWLAWFYRGTPLMRLNRMPEAIQVLERAQALAPKRASAMATLAEFALQAGDQAAADKWIAKLQQAGFDSFAEWHRGEAALVQGDTDKAARHFELVRDSNVSPPGALTGYESLSRLAAEQGFFANAIAILDQAMPLAASQGDTGMFASMLMDRAWLLCQQGKLKPCEGDAESSLRLDNTSHRMRVAILLVIRFAPTAPKEDRAVFSKLLAHSMADTMVHENGPLFDVTRLQAEGAQELVAHHCPSALNALRSAGAIDAPVESRQYLAEGLDQCAQWERSHDKSHALRREAAEAYQPVAFAPAIAWNLLHLNPPAVYADHLIGWLRNTDDRDERYTNASTLLRRLRPQQQSRGSSLQKP